MKARFYVQNEKGELVPLKDEAPVKDVYFVLEDGRTIMLQWLIDCHSVV